MSGAENIQAQVSPDYSMMLEALADIEHKDSFTYLNEALALGFTCARALLANGDRNIPTFLYYEQTPNIFRPEQVDFSRPMPDRSRVSPLLPGSLDVADPFDEEEGFTINFQSETGPQMLALADSLGIDPPTFIEYSLFLRWRWGFTKSIGGRVILNAGVAPPPGLGQAGD